MGLDDCASVDDETVVEAEGDGVALLGLLVRLAAASFRFATGVISGTSEDVGDRLAAEDPGVADRAGVFGEYPPASGAFTNLDEVVDGETAADGGGEGGLLFLVIKLKFLAEKDMAPAARPELLGTQIREPNLGRKGQSVAVLCVLVVFIEHLEYLACFVTTWNIREQ